MLFGRRVPPSLAERVRIMVWPRRSWERSVKYLANRLLRLRADPHQIALGCAIGVFAALTPLVGLQMLMAGAIAYCFRASLPAAMLGTFVGNPVTWAVVWPVTFAIGVYLLGGSPVYAAVNIEAQYSAFWDGLAHFSPHMIALAMTTLWPFLKPMLIGTIPVGLLIGGLIYYYSRKSVLAYQLRRKNRTPYWCVYPLGDLVESYDPAR